MSLINQMLKDLDKRQGGSKPNRNDTISDEISNSRTHHQAPQSGLSRFTAFRLPSSLKWLLFLIVGIWLGMLSWHYWQRQQMPKTPVKSTQTQMVNEVLSSLQQLANENHNQVPLSTVINTTAPTQFDDYTQLADLVEQASQFKQQNQPDLDKIANAKTLAKRTSPQETQSDMAMLGGNHANQAEKVQTEKIFEKPSKQTNQLSHQTITKTRHTSAMNEANASYKKALKMAERHDIKGAIATLTHTLRKTPEFNDARETLAAIYIEQHRYTLAKRLLNQGLSLSPDYPPFISLKARVLVAQQASQSALHLLESYDPEMDQYPNYYAFMAALYQQQGQFLTSAKLYNELIKIEPSNGRWWLGMAIGLKAAGDKNKALIAYKQARLSKELSPQLHAYIDQQISELE